MARVLLLATTTGYQTRAFAAAAERLGVEIVYATDRCDVLDDPWRDGAVALRFHDEPWSVAALIDAVARRPIDGVLAVGDRPTVIAAEIVSALGLAGHSPAAARVARNKLSTRKSLTAAGLMAPWFRAVNVTTDADTLAREIAYPCVVKPLALSASRGVIRADSPPAFIVAFERLGAILGSPEVRGERNEAHGEVLIEGFIPGREVALEAVMDHGALMPLAIFDKPDPLDGPFFEETIYVTPARLTAEESAAVVEAVVRAARAIGLSHGPVHAECRINADGVFVLEAAARPIGGLCARALSFVHRAQAGREPSCSLEELLLQQALGESPAYWQRERAASGVMMIPIPRRGVLRGVSGVEAARQIACVTDVQMTARLGHVLVPLPEGASYLGFIFARATGADAVEQALRGAHARLSFAIDADVRVLQSAHG